MNYVIDENNKKHYYENYITFKASKVLKPDKSLFIVAGEQNEAETKEESNCCRLYEKTKGKNTTRNLPNQKFTIFVDDNGKESDYDRLSRFLKNKDINWDDATQRFKPEKVDNQQTYVQIIKQQFDELVYSNSIAYYLQKYPQFYKAVVNKIIEKTNSNMNDNVDDIDMYKVERERENIDILLTDEKHVIVIENKIKAGVHGKKKEGKDYKTQLEKYHDIVEGTQKKNNTIDNGNESDESEENALPPIKQHGQKSYYALLTPNYYSIDKNVKDTMDKYKYVHITYNDLYKIAESIKIEDDYFTKEFVPDLKIHSSNFSNAFEHLCMQRMKMAADKAKKQ